jgi:putative sugar O-methyltransferase
MSLYSQYEQCVSGYLRMNTLDNFKRNPAYTYMLEHVDLKQGKEYLELIQKTDITQEEILDYSSKNDSVGNPVKQTFGNFSCSPSSLRYIYQAYLIIKHFKTFNQSINIVEVGGGYGGLFLAIEFFARKYNLEIESYTIIDLPVIVKFQELYLSKFSPRTPIEFIDSTTFGKSLTKKYFMISNYCFSEIPREIQEQYIRVLIPKVEHGFITWNNIPVYNFGFEYTEEIEYPLTGPVNKYVRF